MNINHSNYFPAELRGQQSVDILDCKAFSKLQESTSKSLQKGTPSTEPTDPTSPATDLASTSVPVRDVAGPTAVVRRGPCFTAWSAGGSIQKRIVRRTVEQKKHLLLLPTILLVFHHVRLRSAQAVGHSRQRARALAEAPRTVHQRDTPPSATVEVCHCFSRAPSTFGRGLILILYNISISVERPLESNKHKVTSM